MPAYATPEQTKEQKLVQAYVAARMVQVAGRRFPCRTNCLHQSVTLWWLLRRRGIESDLRIGVRKKANQLEAHAWVECQGHVLNDLPDFNERFAPFNCAIISDKMSSL